MTSEKTTFESFSIKELCSLYNISRVTWSKWYKMKKTMIGDKIGGKFTPKQVQIIFQEFGSPV